MCVCVCVCLFVCLCFSFCVFVFQFNFNLEREVFQTEILAFRLQYILSSANNKSPDRANSTRPPLPRPA